MQNPIYQKELFKKRRENMQILPYSEKPVHRESKLFELFESSEMTLDLLVYYLYKRFHQPGVRTYLINKLYEIKNDDLTFYIPELCYFVIKRDSLELERFLLDKCSQSIPLYFQIHWCLTSYGEANSNDSVKYEKLTKFIKFCELSMINRERVDENTKEKLMRYDLKDPQKFAQIYQDKESRNDYTVTVNKFINNLIKISLTLKSQKMEDRKQRLKYYIHRANHVLEENRKKISNILSDFNETVYYQGISLPFSNWQGDRFHSNLMIRILDHDFICFNTKKRVPYKIVVETVDVQDFKVFSPKPQLFGDEPALSSKSSKNSSKDWEIIDEFYDATVFSKNNSKDIAQTKQNKYQGLQDFAKKIAEDEAKKALESRNNERKAWLLPAIALKLPKFLNPFDNNSNNSPEKAASPLLDRSQSHSKFVKTAENLPKLKKMDTKTLNIELQQHFSRVSASNRNFKEFNKKFPLKVPKRRNSGEFAGKFEFDDSPLLKKQRKFSLKSVENVDRVSLLMNLRPQNEANPQKTQEFKLAVMKMEEKLRSEMEIGENSKENQRKGSENDQKEEKKVAKLGPWEEIWEDKAEIIQENSPYGHFPSYKLRSLIVKGGDDLRQEILAMQLIIKFKQIFENAHLKLYLRPYEIIVTSANSGILEFIPNTIAIDGLKKKYPGTSLLQFYKMTYGIAFEEAQKNFIESLAGYSLVSYFLQIKDRHNGNILIDAKGYIIHIDFGFMLAFSPGGINFESAPFKFTSEYLELMGGKDSNLFNYYKCLVIEGFKELRKHTDELCYLLGIMMQESDLPCFTQFKMDVFRERFKENCEDDECETHVEKLIESSIDNWWTIQYDNFQKMTNGINP